MMLYRTIAIPIYLPYYHGSATEQGAPCSACINQGVLLLNVNPIGFNTININVNFYIMSILVSIHIYLFFHIFVYYFFV